MKMKKVVFHISEQLAEQIEGAVERWGFVNKPEFFRYSAIEFLRNDARFMPADNVLEGHKKAILRVKARQSLREGRMNWYKPVSEKEGKRLGY